MAARRKSRLLIVQVAALGADFVSHHGLRSLGGLAIHRASSVFPAVTCPVQATFRTALPPADHGMIANGMLHRNLARVMFWEQSSGLVSGVRIWAGARREGHSVAMLFWQQSQGESVDLLLSPGPIHRHHGGMVQAFHSRPPELYDGVCAALHERFSLHRYWGPMASVASSRWIADATSLLMTDKLAPPDLCLTYLPGLDYDLQRFGPEHARSGKALSAVAGQVQLLVDVASEHGYHVLVFGDYAIAPVTAAPVYPNRLLRKAGLMDARLVGRRLYADLPNCRAFAVADHEIAHVYVRQPEDIEQVKAVLSGGGAGDILDRSQLHARGVAHPNSGELMLVAPEGSWVAYDWWDNEHEAPDFARHIDIHSKPGYDPCELFWGWPPGRVSRNASRVRGTHGRTGTGREVAWGSTFLERDVTSILDLSREVGTWLDLEARGM